ncbi:MAG: SH3 domain-containing protein [Clostridia bacterium]|nr:SH3 domain-containing protein [Clostridia bacterium]
MTKRWLCIILCICMLVAAIPYVGVLADTNLKGVVVLDSGYLNVRTEPGGELVGKLYNGNAVTVLDTSVVNGQKWHKITDGTITGWCSATYIHIEYTYENDEEFEKYLTAQGFPEDYKAGLRTIYAEHPNWVFQAQHLSMTWAEALAAESEARKNAVVSPDAWKSMEYGAYNWDTGTYVEVDSGGWVTASPALVAHYMDPRNFLDSTYIFQFESLYFSEGQTVEGVKAILPSALDKHAEDLVKAARETKVSAYFLATRMAQEGSHVNGLGTGTVSGYEGYYNFFSYGAYAHSGRGAVTNGAIYAKNQGWDTPYKCLLGSAEKIGNAYINKEQNTLYYQKFDVTDGGNGFYTHQYMTNTQAAAVEGATRAESASDAELALSITFIIPVYKDMPATAAPKPGTTGNNNNFLDKLTVDACTLTPSFDRYTMEYSAQVEGDVTQVEIAAVLNSDKAKLTGAGKISLHPGENVIPITVTATSGQARTYTITITREAEVEIMPTITSTAYTISETVTGINPGTKVADFLAAITVKDGTGAVYTAEGKAKAEGTLVTGDILRLYSGAILCVSYPIVIYGDVNGDGTINSQDLRRAQRHILGLDTLKGYALTAADTNMDGKLTSQDLRKSQRFILGITDSLQPTPTTTTTTESTTTTTTGESTTNTTDSTATTSSDTSATTSATETTTTNNTTTASAAAE